MNRNPIHKRLTALRKSGAGGFHTNKRKIVPRKAKGNGDQRAITNSQD